jgi:transcription elongation factor GreA
VSGPDRSAADLIRSVGLLADGPVRWGERVPERGPGIYLVELGAALPTAPLDLALVGKWLERLPDLRMDGTRPTSKALDNRLSSLWWPDARVLYAGSTERSIGGRIAGLIKHVPGERQPHADGQWLHLLRGLDRIGVRIWWAETDAPEEYLDAVLDAFGEGRISPPGRPPGALPVPWANIRRPTGERQAHGLSGQVLPEAPSAPEPARRVVELPPGDADGAMPEAKGAGTTRRAPRADSPPPARRSSVAAGPVVRRAPLIATGGARAASSIRPGHVPEPVQLSKGAHERLLAELDELTRVKRREVVERIKTAREHGDLKENAEYHAAREEQSFLEGRVQALEDRLRRAVVVDETATGRVLIGSKVTVEVGGEELAYTIVGSTEADPAAGRLSSVSPVGAALIGATAGKEVDVKTPRGSVRYRVVSVD